MWDNRKIQDIRSSDFVSVDKGGYSENLLIPAATPEAIKAAVASAVKCGRLWLVNGTISVLGEDVPSGFLNEQAVILTPPAPIPTTDLLPASLELAWKDGETTGHLIHAALSASKGAGKPLPWVIVKRALEDAFRIGLLERALDSSPWPCDLGGAGLLKIRVPKEQPGIKIIKPPTYGVKTATSELETHQIQDLSERISELRNLTAGQKLLIRVSIEIGEGGNVPEDVVDKVNTLLGEIKPGWRAQ